MSSISRPLRGEAELVDGGVGVHLEHLAAEEGDVGVGKGDLSELGVEIGEELGAGGGGGVVSGCRYNVITG